MVLLILTVEAVLPRACEVQPVDGTTDTTNGRQVLTVAGTTDTTNGRQVLTVAGTTDTTNGRQVLPSSQLRHESRPFKYKVKRYPKCNCKKFKCNCKARIVSAVRM
jgi:hypothetical protein